MVETIHLCIYSRSKAFSLSWPIVDLFGVFICFRAELSCSVVATVTGVIAFRTPEVSRRVLVHFIIETQVSSKAVHVPLAKLLMCQKCISAVLPHVLKSSGKASL